MLGSGHPAVLAHLCRDDERVALAVHKLAPSPAAELDLGGFTEIHSNRPYPPAGAGRVEVDGYGLRRFHSDR